MDAIAAERMSSASNALLFCSLWRQGRADGRSFAPSRAPRNPCRHLAGGRATATSREASRGEAIARAAETPHIILNAPLVGQRLGYPDLSRARPARAVRLRPSGALRGADRGGAEPGDRARAAGERCGGRGRAARHRRAAARRARRSRLARARRARGRPMRRCTGSAGAGRRWSAPGSSGPSSGERMLFSRLRQWEEGGRPAAAAHGDGRPARGARQARPADRRAPRRARASGRWPRR